mmetsp:Transcript_13053/g.17800  ORF Transcript_13053/g.17800 Transcript_13053/m.17800 type:complete len:320 (+) Transcript_13053:400-1359(+)
MKRQYHDDEETGAAGPFRHHGGKSSRTSSYGSKEFIYGVKDKTKWSKLLEQLKANFQTSKILYLNDEAELLRRKTSPVPPPRIPVPPAENENQKETRRYNQSLIDDEHKAKQSKYRTYMEQLPQDFGTAIALVLSSVSDVIRQDLQDNTSKLPMGYTPEEEYQALRSRLEEKWGPNSQADALELSDKLSTMNGDAVGWQNYGKQFDLIVQTMKRTIIRDEFGLPDRWPAATMPHQPFPIEPATNAEMVDFYVRSRNAAAIWNAVPHLGEIKTYEPSQQVKKGILIRALSRSAHSAFSLVASHYRRAENQAKPFAQLWTD